MQDSQLSHMIYEIGRTFLQIIKDIKLSQAY
jgi:hypothetical protein